MGTPYSDIYKRAMFRFTDKKFAFLEEDEQKLLLGKYLDSAISDFKNKCKENLELRDEVTQEFDAELSNEVQEILALGVSYYWLSAQVLNTDLLRNKLSTKDYSYFSPANLLREMTRLKNDTRKEYQHRIINYTYDHNDLTLKDRGM